MKITVLQSRVCRVVFGVLSMTSALSVAAGENDVSLRRVTDPSHGTTRLAVLVGSTELASVETVDPSASLGCRTPLRLKLLGQIRDLLAGGPDAQAQAFVSALLGSFADVPTAQIPEEATEQDVSAQGCSATVKYRYNTCSGDCGTVDGREVTCTCEVTRPTECRRAFHLPHSW